MKKIVVALGLSLLVASPVSADLVCVKSLIAAKKGKVSMKKAFVTNALKCPKGFIQIFSGLSSISSGSITSDKLAAESVSAEKIQAGAVTTDKLADGSVTPAKLQAGAISADSLGTSSVSSDKIQAGAITAEKLAADAVARSISISPSGFYLLGGASFIVGAGSNAGVSLPNSGVPSFYAGFTIPSNYIPGTLIRAKFTVSVPSTSCTVILVPNAISVTRVGSTPIEGPNTGTGLTVAGGNTITFSASPNTAKMVEADIAAPDGDQLFPGDAIIFSLFRSSAADTCSSTMMIHGLEVNY